VIANLLVDGRPIGTRSGFSRLLRIAAVSAVIMTAWDLVVDPILSGPYARAWIWENGGPYFGIPIQNYAGWLVTTFTVYVAYRAVEQRVEGAARGGVAARGGEVAGGAGGVARVPVGLGPVGARVAALPVAAYGLMLASNLLSGVAPTGVAVIGSLAMGPPAALAAWRLWRMRAS
jgi:putative membrane protein